MTTVRRTIHPIGQGLFCTEQICNGTSKFNVVYDCGSFNHNALSDEIKRAFDEKDVIDVVFISHLHYDHISGLKELASQYKIKAVVMPQLSEMMLVESFAYNCLYGHDAEINQRMYQLYLSDSTHYVPSNTEIPSGNENEELPLGVFISTNNARITIDGKWEYIPYNYVSDEVANSLTKYLKELFLKDSNFAQYFQHDKIDIEEFLAFISTPEGRKKCAEIYKKVTKKNNQNEYSMPVYSGPIMHASMHVDCCIDYICDEMCDKLCHAHCFKHCHSHCHVYWDADCCAPCPLDGSLANCLYTGDFDANPKKSYYQDMIKFYHNDFRWERIKMVQVPHHGSKHNHNTDMYRGRCWAVISCGTSNRFRHPHSECLAGIITTGCHCSIVNENSHLNFNIDTH